MQEYRQLNMKLTPQRIAILNFMKGNTSHPSAEDIYKAVQKEFPTMSFATVYNTVEALKNKGILRELKIDSNKKRYDPDCSTHHHLICTKCKKVVDVVKNFKLNLSEDLIDGFELTGNSIEFFGLCRNCKDT
jgi:Fur family peroxide stress response transcriptional regulator